MGNKPKIAYTYFVPALMWALFILLVCLVPPKYIPEVEFNLLSPDKIVHAGLFGFLCLLILWALLKTGLFIHKNILIVVGITIAYGAVIELLQMVSRAGRQADVDDILANAAGAVLVYLFYVFYYRSLIRKTS